MNAKKAPLVLCRRLWAPGEYASHPFWLISVPARRPTPAARASVRGRALPAVDECHALSASVLAEKLGEGCARCGWSERHPTTGKVPVEVEHIDGDWRNTRPENLTLLCPNCHSLTTTYRALNRGNGRPDRNGRVQRGSMEPVKGGRTARIELPSAQLLLQMKSDADVA
jgi:hypothetical protein